MFEYCLGDTEKILGVWRIRHKFCNKTKVTVSKCINHSHKKEKKFLFTIKEHYIVPQAWKALDKQLDPSSLDKSTKDIFYPKLEK